MQDLNLKKRPISQALISFDLLPDSAHVDVRVVADLFACSVPTIWRRVTSGLIPSPKRFGRTTRWNVGELRDALAAPHEPNRGTC